MISTSTWMLCLVYCKDSNDGNCLSALPLCLSQQYIPLRLILFDISTH